MLHILDEDPKPVWTALRIGLLTSITISQMALFSVPVSVDIPFMLPTLMTIPVVFIIFSQKVQPYIPQLYHGAPPSRGTKILHIEKS